MAKAGTTNWEHGGFINGKCDDCGASFELSAKETARPVHRKFYNPSVMNGDAECLESLCNNCYKKN